MLGVGPVDLRTRLDLMCTPNSKIIGRKYNLEKDDIKFDDFMILLIYITTTIIMQAYL